MSDIYSAAQAGKLEEAQVMVQQVLISHPKSAKAFFIQAELYARQGNFQRARESLSTAESHAPGLPFAKPESVQALRAQLADRPTPKPAGSPAVRYATAPTSVSGGNSWLLPLLLTGGVIAAAFFLYRRRQAEACMKSPMHGMPNGLSGPQTFGAGSGVMQQPAYSQMGHPEYQPSPTQPSMAGRIAGGVATGLAVGAGVMAAEALGRTLMGGSNHTAGQVDKPNATQFESFPSNTEMGGNNFGINDTTWDDGSSANVGSGEWDN